MQLSKNAGKFIINNWAGVQQNQENHMCGQGRLRSAWAFARSDQSLRCPHEEASGPWLFIERTAKTLFRLCGCTGWSESSLGSQVILLFFSDSSEYFSTSLSIITEKVWKKCFVCLCCCFTAQSTAKVMSSRSVNLSTLFLGKLPERLTMQYKAHIFLSNWQLPYLNQR